MNWKLVRWSSLISNERGEIEQEKLRSIAAIMLGIAGGVAVYLAMTGHVVPRTEIVVIGVAALVAPLTGAKVADTWASWRLGKESANELKELKAVAEQAAQAARDAADLTLQGNKQGEKRDEKLEVIGRNVDGAKTALELVAQRLRDRLTEAGIEQPPGTAGVDPAGTKTEPMP